MACNCKKRALARQTVKKSPIKTITPKATSGNKIIRRVIR